MKHLFSVFLLWLTVFNLKAAMPEPMNPPRLVNDFVSLLSSSENEKLEQKLRWYNDSTSTQISIVTIKDLEGYEVADYANELARKWGIGQKGKDNGILILVSLSPRKVTIQTGYGVEALLPDVVCGRIIRETIAPNFKAGNYFNGLNAAIDEIYGRLTGAYVNDKVVEVDILPLIIIGFIIFIIVLIILSRINRNRKGTFTKRGYYNSPDIWINPGGGGWFDRGGGSSGGGGGIDFGGFGGGDFGGGGASGDW